MSIRRIGILTSGGDSPGMNSIIYSAFKSADAEGIEVFGIYRGFNGLIKGDFKKLGAFDVEDIVKKGGTILYSARCKEFKDRSGLEIAVKNCKEKGLDGLVVVGGDGTFKGAYNLYKAGVPCVCLPGTIDNDISCTEYTVGYDTAVNTAIEMVDKLIDTTASHDRCSVVEVMGRNSGYIALEVGLACSASYIVVPEYRFNKEDLFKRLEDSIRFGRKHFVVVVAECLLDVNELAREIEEKFSIETRATVLGHVQRGGAPTAKDRVLGIRFGAKAVELLKLGRHGRVVGIKNGELVDYDIPKGLEIKKELPKNLYELARSLY